MEKRLGKYLIVEKAIDSLLNSLLPTKEATRGIHCVRGGGGEGGGGGGVDGLNKFIFKTQLSQKRYKSDIQCILLFSPVRLYIILKGQ